MHSCKVKPGSEAWTPERRARQAALIRAWKPWLQSTGPKTLAGKAKASRNAFTGGHAVMLRQLAKELNAAMREQRGGWVKSLEAGGTDTARFLTRRKNRPSEKIKRVG